MNELTDAKDRLERARISNDIATNRDVAVILHPIARCLIEMNELTDAKDI